MKQGRRPELPCPACGGQSYSWGRLQGHRLQFVAAGASFWDRLSEGWKFSARRCDDCGNLQIFTEPTPSPATKRTRNAAEADFS